MRHCRRCFRCGAHLDPGETCDCLEVEAKVLIDHLTEDECTSVLELWHDKKTAASSAKADSGKEAQHDH